MNKKNRKKQACFRTNISPEKSFKGFSRPTGSKRYSSNRSLAFYQDLQSKVCSGELKPGREIALLWVRSLDLEQRKKLNTLLDRDPNADLIATAIQLATLEQHAEKIEFTEEDLVQYCNRFSVVVSLVNLVDLGLIETTHFPPIYEDEPVGIRPRGNLEQLLGEDK